MQCIMTGKVGVLEEERRMMFIWISLIIRNAIANAVSEPPSIIHEAADDIDNSDSTKGKPQKSLYNPLI